MKPGTDCIGGVKLVQVDLHPDSRGVLGVLELGKGLDFPVKRIFYMVVDDPKTVRAKHAVSSTQLITPIVGAVTIDLDNGTERQTVTLADRSTALQVAPGIWRRLRDFAMPLTVVLVAASTLYAETVVSEAPQRSA